MVLPQSHDVEAVNKQVRFDVVVERGVSTQARREIHLQDIWLEVIIENDVEAKELKAVLWPARALDLLAACQ